MWGNSVAIATTGRQEVQTCVLCAVMGQAVVTLLRAAESAEAETTSCTMSYNMDSKSDAASCHSLPLNTAICEEMHAYISLWAIWSHYISSGKIPLISYTTNQVPSMSSMVFSELLYCQANWQMASRCMFSDTIWKCGHQSRFYLGGNH